MLWQKPCTVVSALPKNLIPIVEEPINVFKNQIMLSLGEKSYKFEIVFPTFHRHSTVPIFNSKNMIKILKEW